MKSLEKSIVVTGLTVIGGVFMYGLGRLTESKKNVKAWKDFRDNMDELIVELENKKVEKEA